METSNKLQNVKQTAISTAKTVGNGAMYSVEKPLIGVAAILHSAAAVLTATECGIMSGAAALHAKRTGKDYTQAKADIYKPYDAAFAKIDGIIEKNMDTAQAKYEQIMANRKAKALVKAAKQREADIAKAKALLAEVAGEHVQAELVLNSRLS